MQPFDVERIRQFLLGMTDKRAILEKGNLQPNVVPFVRIPAIGSEDVLSQVKQALDVGAYGVMFPCHQQCCRGRDGRAGK